MTSENEERFLREIASRIAMDRIVEVHLFASLRQNGSESGVAVVAAELPAVGEEPAAATQGGGAGDRLRSRLAVYTARYRHFQKGPERGRWEFEIAAEAEAPLLTVDRVVRGVLQRSGEQGEPVRLSADEIRASIGDVECTTTKF